MVMSDPNEITCSYCGVTYREGKCHKCQKKPDAIINKKKVIYKIRDRNTGLYSGGGCAEPTWSPRGKTWGGIGSVLNHLAQYTEVSEYKGKCEIKIPAEWEIVKVEYVESEAPFENARQYYIDNAPRLKKFAKRMEEVNTKNCGKCFYWEKRGAITACLKQMASYPASSPACALFVVKEK